MPSAISTNPVILRVPGFLHSAQLYVHNDRDTVISPVLLRDQCWEPLESEVLCRALKPGDAVLDVGANIGYFTMLSALSVGDGGRVWAFEPEPFNVDLLQRNVVLNDVHQVEIVAAALGDHAGEMPLFLSSHNAGDHSLTAAADRDAVVVNVMRGDDCLPADIIVQLIKIDVQGAEPAVLAGLSAVIERSLPDVRLMIEFCPQAMDRYAPNSADQLLVLLRRWDLPIYVIDHWRNALVETTVDYLNDWLRACRAESDDEGFFNLLIGEPPEGIRRFTVCGC
jgi:FkbM family methyltransferase